MSSATKGRLFTKSSGEGGADQIYDGAAKSAFDDALGNKKGSAAWQSKGGERSKVETMAPEVDVHSAGIAESAGTHGKPQANWAAAKPRFEDAKLSTTADYDTAKSAFDNVQHRPTPNMMTPQKNHGRDSWVKGGVDQVDTPGPGSANPPGAFDSQLKKTTPSAFAHSGGDRFKNLYTVASHGEPSSTADSVSDFDKALRNAKPSANAASHVDRFKQAYDIPSYGDPGASSTSVDVERQQRDQKLSRQRAQAEAERNRVMQS
eukprot:c6425_g1_i1.p1 GENE.c6425_g1_i1~~c6425_g1_i1.p1  ORF type:complete len:276 (-),score=62.42 c6425_g1_i1:29-814(-)